MAKKTETLLEIRDLKTHFPITKGVLLRRQVGAVKAVDGISLTLQKGEVLGLVGESGCGKSTLGRTIIQLLRATEGRVVLGGENLGKLTGRQLRKQRAHFQMIFQDPYATLNPRMTIRDTLSEAMTAHERIPKAKLEAAVGELMQKVGLSAGGMNKYPHEFSGGQRQRIAIARALAVKPQLIVADEPVSALDVSIQAQILNLLTKLTRELGLTLIFISHDLSVVKYISDRIAVMYLGKIVEIGPAVQIVEKPLHPYTRALVSAIPIPDPDREKQRQRIILSGDPPSPIDPPVGCAFHPRCAYAIEPCKIRPPVLVQYISHHLAACIRVGEI